MTRLTIDSPSLRTFATTQRTSAADTEADAARQRSAVTDLAITFGMIGAEFLSALLHVFELYTQNVEDTAQRHDAVSDRTDRADAAYTECDCRCGREISSDDSAEKERTL